MNNYIEAIHNKTRYSVKLIEQTINDGENKGMPPVKFPGSMTWEIWQMYQGIREYERINSVHSDVY